ncbi:MAG: response regulator [Ginsengibacter sp.]
MKKVLVVDDDKSILEVVELILTSKGYDVKTYATGHNVSNVVNNYDPDLVLLDINLPHKTGIEICNELKAISNHPPILLFSAHANAKQAMGNCTAEGFISKPFNVSDLLNSIGEHI